MPKSKSIVILGAGESGAGAAVLAKKQGWDVFVSDMGLVEDEYKFVFERKGIVFEEQKHTLDKILAADLVVKSPGIPDSADVIVKLKAQGTSIVSEIEFASRYTTGVILAITGSNGKTTTTSLVYHILKTANYNVALGGNIGISFAKNVADCDYKYHVLEVSSFQLDDTSSFRPDVAVLLNITPDHLDRYNNDFNTYVDSKCSITSYQTPEDAFVFNDEDESIHNWLMNNEVEAEMHPVKPVLVDGKLLVEGIYFDLSQFSLQGPHNIFNATCAIKAALQVGVTKEAIQEALNTIQNVAHRLELVDKIEGVSYVNDSKATNVDAVVQALNAFEQPIVWIVGGVDKGNDYASIYPLVKEKVKAIICLGKDNSKLKAVFEDDYAAFIEVQSVGEAVKKAAGWSVAGDVVLLSPACASFDLFKNYEDRGDQFKKEVSVFAKYKG